MSEDAVTRRAIMVDLIENYPEIDDMDYETILAMDLHQLHEVVEQKKIQCRMKNAAMVIQRCWKRRKYDERWEILNYKKNRAATMFQNAWRNHR